MSALACAKEGAFQMKIAMWSGPRNLSTAMMYSFAQRSDCAVWDEPFYAAYLTKTGLIHPMADEVLNAGERDADRVIAACVGSNPAEKPIFYQKHMTQHMVSGVDRDWISDVTNVFLIRHPARVIASYAAKRENPTLDDIGFRQQAELFDLACAFGQRPIVLDSTEIRADPERSLTQFCRALGIAFEEAMLSWPVGGNAADGVWAPHWYGAVHRSTGFSGAEGPLPDLSGEYAALAQEAMPFYTRLLSFAQK